MSSCSRQCKVRTSHSLWLSENENLYFISPGAVIVLFSQVIVDVLREQELRYSKAYYLPGAHNQWLTSTARLSCSWSL